MKEVRKVERVRWRNGERVGLGGEGMRGKKEVELGRRCKDTERKQEWGKGEKIRSE